MTAPIRAMIVDDEPLARARIRGLLARQPDLRLVAECADGAAAREAIAADRPEVVFLDIEMAEVSGLAVAEGLAESMEAGPAVVFVTAHERYARQAFDVRAIDMLVPQAYAQGAPQGVFVFDDQTHIIRSSRVGPGNALRDIAQGGGPRHSLFAFGYAGWAPDQLEGEIARGSFSRIAFSTWPNGEWMIR